MSQSLASRDLQERLVGVLPSIPPARPLFQGFMERLTLPSSQVLPELQETVAEYHRDVVTEIVRTLEQSPVVVVGMTINPFVKKARQALDQAGIPYAYLEYGGYLSRRRERLAIKMWSGWPTFPQVFVQGQLVGGATDLERWIREGRLQSLLQSTEAA